MKPLVDIYKRAFFTRRYKFNWRALHVADAFEKLYPDIFSYIDVGCATGDLVFEMGRRGHYSWGIEGSTHCWEFRMTDNILIRDLREPLEGLLRMDLCSCLEVMEHIEKEYSDILVDNLIKLSDKLILSAAPPGQKGHYHVNCQPLEYWIEKFRNKGYEYRPVLTNLFKKYLSPWALKPGIEAFHKNAAIFEKVKK